VEHCKHQENKRIQDALSYGNAITGTRAHIHIHTRTHHAYAHVPCIHVYTHTHTHTHTHRHKKCTSLFSCYPNPPPFFLWVSFILASLYEIGTDIWFSKSWDSNENKQVFMRDIANKKREEKSEGVEGTENNREIARSREQERE